METTKLEELLTDIRNQLQEIRASQVAALEELADISHRQINAQLAAWGVNQ